MGTSRAYRLAAVVLAVLAAGVPAAGPPAQAATKDDGLSLVVPLLAPMLPGQEGWVAAIWSANEDVCDVQVTLSGTGVTATYPTNTGTFSSLYTSNGLAQDNMDYTAFDLTVGANVVVPVVVTMDLTYRELPPGQIKKTDDLKTKKFVCSGLKGSQSVTATLPVIPTIGAAVVQKTTAASVPRSTPTWTNITFRGTKPNLANFRVTLTPPAGMTVAYPGDATSAGLHDTSTLPVGADDYAAVRLDASRIATGVYQVPVHATYTGGSFDGTVAITVT